MSGKFVAYYRVSTRQQGRSGLGLEGQRAAVLAYLRSAGGSMVNEITEIESGRRLERERPALSRALELCRRHDATLLIAKLDRLARNVALVARLMESDVRFVAADMPHANRLTLHIIAAMAEYESRLTGDRISAALRAYVKRGGKMGFQHLRAAARREVSERGHRTLTARCAAAIERVLPTIKHMRSLGIRSFSGLARGLTARGIPTALGRKRWNSVSLKRGLERLDPTLVKRLRLGGMSQHEQRLHGQRNIGNWVRYARSHASAVEQTIDDIRAGGALTSTAIAAELNRRGVQTAFRKPWNYRKVSDLVRYLQRIRDEPLPLPRQPISPLEYGPDSAYPAWWAAYALEREVEALISDEIERRIDGLRARQGAIRNAIAAASMADGSGEFNAAINTLRSELAAAGAELGLTTHATR